MSNSRPQAAEEELLLAVAGMGLGSWQVTSRPNMP